MTVKEWVDFLQKDKKVKKIGLEMQGGFPCKKENYLRKEVFMESFYSGWLDDEVVDVCSNYPEKGYVLLTFKT